MTITGKNLIAGEWSGETNNGFSAINAINNQAMEATFADATPEEIDQAIARANQAFHSYQQLPAIKRAQFLRTIGDEILALGDELITMASAET